VTEVVLDDPALRKAGRGDKPNLTILGVKVIEGDITAARAAFDPPPAVKPGKDK
jgi:hypothetical protein